MRHLIQAGVDPHTVMAFSGHRTPAMLRRYHIIDVDDLRLMLEPMPEIGHLSSCYDLGPPLND